MSVGLKLKSILVASPFEGLAKQTQWILSARHRWSHPELSDLFLDEKRLPDVLTRLLTKQSNVLDVGCHIGSFLSAAIRLAPDGKHCAIEASPTKAAWLNSKFYGVRIEQVAIADYTGTATFEENIARPGFSKLQGDDPTSDPANRYDVKVTTLDALDIGRIDLMKIDIEGAELAALKGAGTLIESSRPAIIFECGADANAGLNRRALFDYLTGPLSYEVFTFGDFLYNKGPLGFDEFRKCGVYPFRAFNFLAMPR